MESAWLAIIVGMAAFGALSAWISRTDAAQRIAELLKLDGQPEWAKK